MEFATGALGTLLPKLAQLVKDEYNLPKNVKKDIGFLSSELEYSGAALRKIGEVPLEQQDEQVKIWARDVQELSYDMEDAVDKFLVRVEGPDPPSKKSFKRFIKKMIKMVTKATTRHGIADEIMEIKERVKDIADRRDRYKVHTVSPGEIKVDPRVIALYTKVTDLVGLDEARKEVIQTLTDGDAMSTEQQRIVSIVGFGGLGKTTLAKVVYDELKGQFSCMAFVSVSRTPDLKKLLKDMLYELDKGMYGNIHSRTLDEKQLIDLIQEFLLNKRYLIVIDDLWEMTPWTIIRCALSENNMRSRVIITTRIIGVAEQVGYCYKLKPLTHESSKILFHGRIFGSEDKCPEQLAELSEKVLKKCDGVPLAIITTSSLLANKLRSVEVWYEVYNSIGSGLEGNYDMENMRKILSLSFYDLPSHLKTCLLFLSIFPEDYKISKYRLIWRWIAEDLVKRGEEDCNLIDIGEYYFNELLNRSLIQPADLDPCGIPFGCRVHDMVLDLICSLSRAHKFVTTVSGHTKQNTLSSGRKVRRLSIHNTTTLPQSNMPSMRSLTIFHPDITNVMSSIPCYLLLRVLDVACCNLKNCPNLGFLGYLLHLRYLGLNHTGYAGELPAEIGKLQFLQTLDICGTDIAEWPSSIVGLRQLSLLCFNNRTRMPNGLRYLTSLEMLAGGRVDSAYSAEELGYLTRLSFLRVHLNGRLDDSLGKAFLKSLGNLNRIRVLAISVDMSVNLEGSVESLASLRMLVIRKVSWFPAWINPESLPLVSSLVITVKQVRKEDIQILGMLPALDYVSVHVEGTSDIQVKERLVFRVGAFPCVRRCEFKGFAIALSMFPKGAMPMLEHIEFEIYLDDFSNGDFDDLAMGHLPSLRSVEVRLSSKRRVSKEMVMKVEEMLRHEADVHPNHPSIECYRYWVWLEKEEEERNGQQTQN
ncbi:hypothetical protein ACP70R_007872 [Stipagrostis hirtigluma subsp. patula]